MSRALRRTSWGSKVPLTARTEIAERVRAGTPVRDLAREYGIHKSRVYQILREGGIHGSRYPDRPDRAVEDDAWVKAHRAVYEDAELRRWLEARLRAFLANWHRRQR